MSETLETTVARLTASIKPMTPEQEAERQREQFRIAAGNRNTKIKELTEAGDFPLRHLSCTPIMNGPWAAKFNELRMKLGTGRLLALIGTRGNGKTQLAVSLALDQIRTHQMPARFTTATAFFMAIKSTYRPLAEDDEAKVVREFAKPTLLIIDEIGKRGGSEWEHNLLFELVNRRYNDMKDTILIDNRTVQEFSTTIGPSLASRMNEGGGVVQCDWETFRK